MPDDGKKSLTEKLVAVLGGLSALAIAATGLVTAYNGWWADAPAQAGATSPDEGSGGDDGAPADENESAAQALAAGEERSGCDRIGELRSAATGREVPVTFVNHSDRPVFLSWINSEGEPVATDPDGQAYGSLAPGEDTTLTSLEQHVWVLKDEQGACRRVIVVGRTAATYTYQ